MQMEQYTSLSHGCMVVGHQYSFSESFDIVDSKYSFPHPGSENWGKGLVVVTTNDDRIIQHHNDCAELMELQPMSEDDATALLNSVSGCYGEDAKDIVNSKYVGRVPIEIVR